MDFVVPSVSISELISWTKFQKIYIYSFDYNIVKCYVDLLWQVSKEKMRHFLWDSVCSHSSFRWPIKGFILHAPKLGTFLWRVKLNMLITYRVIYHGTYDFVILTTKCCALHIQLQRNNRHNRFLPCVVSAITFMMSNGLPMSVFTPTYYLIHLGLHIEK